MIWFDKYKILKDIWFVGYHQPRNDNLIVHSKQKNRVQL